MNKIIVYFVLGCLTIRFGLAYLAYIINVNYLPYMGIISGLISVAFLYKFIEHKKGEKGVFGTKVWWNINRFIHSLLFGLFSFLAINKYKHSWVVLFIDALLGLASFVFKKFNN